MNWKSHLEKQEEGSVSPYQFPSVMMGEKIPMYVILIRNVAFE
jgi:hypothetical protein